LTKYYALEFTDGDVRGIQCDGWSADVDWVRFRLDGKEAIAVPIRSIKAITPLTEEEFRDNISEEAPVEASRPNIPGLEALR
jgi:hypothetical protein